MFNARIIKTAAVTAFAAAALFTAASIAPDTATAGARSHPVYAFGGNEFIIRKMPAGHGRYYLYAYQRTGDQWEQHSIVTINPKSKRHGRSIPENIYRRGRYMGHISVDLDNPMNTHMNRYPGR